MNRFHLQLIFAFLIFANSAYTQNNIKLTKDYNTIIPTELSGYIDANMLLETGLNGLMNPKNKEKTFSISFFPVFRYIKGSLDDALTKANPGKNWNELQKRFQELKTVFFKNKENIEMIYKAVIPAYLEEFKKTDAKNATIILDSLQNALAYAKNFDFEKEKILLEKSNAMEYGKFKAFIFRRIASKELAKEEVVTWLERILGDFKSVLPNKGEKVGGYMAVSFIAGSSEGETLNYYLAQKEDAETYTNIIVQENNEAKLLFEEDVTINDINAQGFSAYEVKDKNGKMEFLLFRENGKPAKEILYRFATPSDIVNQIHRPSLNIYIFRNGGVVLFEADVKKEVPPTFLEGSYLKHFLDKSTNNLYILFKDSPYVIVDSNRKVNKMKETLKDVRSIQQGFFTMRDVYNEYKQMADKEVLLLEYGNGKKECIMEINQKITTLSLPAGYNYTYLQQWKNYLIFRILESKEKNSFYGIMSLKGKIIKEPVHPIIFSLGDCILFGEKVGERMLINIHDAALKKTSGPDYEFPLQRFREAQYFGIEEVYSDVIDWLPFIYVNAERLSLQLSKYNGNTLTDTKAVLLDFSGKTIIQATWEFINQIHFDEKLNKSYYVVCDKVSIDETNVITPNGKLALFSQDGKQLTEFKYTQFSAIDEGDFSKDPIHFKAYFEGGHDVLDENGKVTETIKD